jgi:hypothetical protein
LGQLGLARRWNARRAKAAKQKPLSEGEQGWMQVTIRFSPEGRGKNFFLDILFHRITYASTNGLFWLVLSANSGQKR